MDTESVQRTIQRCALGIGLVLFSQCEILSMPIYYLQMFCVIGGMALLFCENLKNKSARFAVCLAAIGLSLYCYFDTIV